MIASVSVNSLIGNLDITRVNNINTINIGTLSGQITISQIQNLGSFNISSFTGNLDVSRVQNLGTLSISSFTGNLDVSRVQNLGTLSISSFTGNLDVSRIQNLSTFSIANFSGSLDVSKVANLTTVSVGSFSGVIVTSQIAAGLLSDLTKYSDSVRPIASVTGLPALPNANYPVGAVVYNTNDGKIWRNVNGAWSSATAASDVSGALTAATIEAIHLTTLNGLITGAQIGQINASSISVVNAGAVYGGLTNASISALNITTLNGGIQANQIASINFNNTSLTGQIQATNIGSINASTINVISNQITGIQAGNITAGTITGWTINGTTINSTNINSSVISLTYNFGRAQGVPVELVNAQSFMITDEQFASAVPQFDQINELVPQKLKPILESGKIVVTQGFVGATVSGKTTTLGEAAVRIILPPSSAQRWMQMKFKSGRMWTAFSPPIRVSFRMHEKSVSSRSAKQQNLPTSAQKFCIQAPFHRRFKKISL